LGYREVSRTSAACYENVSSSGTSPPLSFQTKREQKITGNLDIEDEPTPGGRLGNTTNTTASQELFGNTTPSQAPTNPAVAAKDPNRSTTEQTGAWSDRQEEQDYINTMQDIILDTTTVTPNNNTSTVKKKRNRGNMVGQNIVAGAKQRSETSHYQ
jgi:hypothetical protein